MTWKRKTLKSCDSCNFLQKKPFEKKKNVLSWWRLGHVLSVSLSVSLCSSIVQIITGLVSSVVVIFMVLVGGKKMPSFYVLVLVDVEWNPCPGWNGDVLDILELTLVQFLLVLQHLKPEQSPPCVWCWPLLFRAHTCLVLTSSLVYAHSLRVSIPPGMSPDWLELVLHRLAYDTTAIHIGRNIWGKDNMCLHKNLKNHKNVSRGGLELCLDQHLTLY